MGSEPGDELQAVDLFHLFDAFPIPRADSTSRDLPYARIIPPKTAFFYGNGQI